jgi:hypothetical protein
MGSSSFCIFAFRIQPGVAAAGCMNLPQKCIYEGRIKTLVASLATLPIVTSFRSFCDRELLSTNARRSRSRVTGQDLFDTWVGHLAVETGLHMDTILHGIDSVVTRSNP